MFPGSLGAGLSLLTGFVLLSSATAGFKPPSLGGVCCHTAARAGRGWVLGLRGVLFPPTFAGEGDGISNRGSR